MFDESLPAYCGYCKREVWADPVELVIDSDPEIRHYECPHCKRKIGGSWYGDIMNVLMFVAFVAGAWVVLSFLMHAKL